MIGRNVSGAPIVIQDDPRVELSPGEQLEVGSPTALMLGLRAAGLLVLTDGTETAGDKGVVVEAMRTLLTEYERH